MDLILLGDCLTSLFETTTPSGTPLHRGRDRRKGTLQCFNVAHPPLCKGELEGVVRKIKDSLTIQILLH